MAKGRAYLYGRLVSSNSPISNGVSTTLSSLDKEDITSTLEALSSNSMIETSGTNVIALIIGLVVLALLIVAVIVVVKVVLRKKKGKMPTDSKTTSSNPAKGGPSLLQKAMQVASNVATQKLGITRSSRT